MVEEYERTKLAWEATYKKFTQDTAQYPKEREMDYLMIGLANEVGELLGKYKKMIRGDETFYEVMIANIEKLNSRMARDVIKGDGDDR